MMLLYCFYVQIVIVSLDNQVRKLANKYIAVARENVLVLILFVYWKM